MLRVERVHLPIFQAFSNSVINISLHFYPDKKNADETKLSGLRMVTNFSTSQKEYMSLQLCN